MIRKVFLKEATLIFLLCALLITIWFRQVSLYAGGEPGIPFYDLSRYFTLVSHLWYDAGTGHPFLSLITGIPYFGVLDIIYQRGVDGVLLQAVTFLILILVGTLSTFYLVKTILGEELKGVSRVVIPLVAGVFYLLNPFSMTQVWGRGIYGQFFSFAITPLFVLLFIVGVKERRLFYSVLGVIASVFFSFAFVSPTQVIVLWMPVALYLFFVLFTGSKSEKYFVLKTFLFTLVSWLLAHSWWSLSYLKSGSNFYSYFLQNPEENLGTLLGVSAHFPFSSMIRLIQGYHLFIAKSYGDVYLTPLFQTISWLIPATLLFSLSYLRKVKNLRYFAVLFLIGLLVSLGANPPIGKIFVWIFMAVPYLQAFRNPYEKFGLILTLAYTPFFALGVYNFSQKIASSRVNRKGFYFTLLGVIFLICGVYVWPMWTGHVAGGLTTNAWVKVPTYYKEANTWLETQTKEGDRILQVPLIPGEGVRYNWEHSYQGAEPSEFLFTVSSIGRNTIVNKPYYNILLERFDSFHPNLFGPDPDTSDSTFRSRELYQELEKLAVRYIVLHRDLDENIGGSKSPGETAAFLEKQPKIKKVKTFGELDIYEVDTSAKVARIYSPDVETEFVRYNPTHYEVDIRGSKGEIELYFLDLFDPGWEAFVDGEKVNEHYRVFDYANAWKINKDGNYKVIIKYKFQEIVYSGMEISLASLASLILLGFYWWRKQTTH